MLSNTMLRNLNTSYNRMANLQEQIQTGSKLLRPSDDPVGVTKAMSYRTQLNQNAQYDKNLDTATKFLDTTDAALQSVSSAMTRVQELITQAANDTNQTIDREKMLTEIKQIQAEIQDLGNTKIGDTYIFSGTRTSEPLYIDAKVTTTSVTDSSDADLFSVKTSKEGNKPATSTIRDGQGNKFIDVKESTDAAGNQVFVVTDTNGKEITSADGQVTDYNGNKVSVATDGKITLTDPKNNVIEFDPASNAIVFTPTSTTTATVGTPTVTTERQMQALPGMTQSATLEIYNGIELDVNTTGAQALFAKLDTVFAKIETALTGTNGTTSADAISTLLGGANSDGDKANETIQGSIDLVLKEVANVGAKQNRVDMMDSRLALQKITLTKQQSNVESVEYEQAITNLITQESIHNAALSVGGRVIQQTLVDFIR